LQEVKLEISNLDSSSELVVKGIASLPKNDNIKYGETKYVYAVISKENSAHPFP